MMSTIGLTSIKVNQSSIFDTAALKSINKGGYILIALGIIVFIGSLIATGCLYSHLSYNSFAIGSAGVIICILSFLLGKYCCKNMRTPIKDILHAKQPDVNSQLVQSIDGDQKSIPALFGATDQVNVTTLPYPIQICAVKKPETNPLPIPPEGIIKNGYGEYLIYRITSGGKKEAITDIEYEKIYDILEEVRVLQGDQIPQNRHHYLKTSIQKELDQSVFISFIPRTIYELVYLRECIQEDLDKGSCCNARESGILDVFQEKTPDNMKQGIINFALEAGFWQQCLFEDKDYEIQFATRNQFDYRILHIRKIAAKLNCVALKYFNTCCSDDDGFTYTETQKIQEELLNFFKELYNPQSELHAKAIKIHELTYPGIARQCAEEATRAWASRERFPLGIANERHEKIIQHAILLECSPEAANAMVFYRGSQLSMDNLTYHDGEITNAYSLSYGTSLYAGALYDGGATAFHYMRQNHLEAQAHIVSFKKIYSTKAVFHVFNVNPLIQLMSKGEIFHPRTKVWELNAEDKVLGFIGLEKINYVNVKTCCKTSLSQETMEKKFSKYKNRVYLLA